MWLLLACQTAEKPEDTGSDGWFLPLPDGFPVPLVPEDNPATPEKFAYGRALFYDRRLSGNGSQSCADCHLPQHAFTDQQPTPTGSTGDPIPRNSMALVNVAWESSYTWANPLLNSLEKQLLVPMYNDVPIELGMSGHDAEIVARLEAEPRYAPLAAAAFPDEDPFEQNQLVRAIATFVRGLVSSDSPYDRYVYQNDPSGMSDDALLGMGLFFGEQAECYHCHSGTNLTASFVSTGSAGKQEDFFNNGLYNLDGAGAYPAGNQGLFELTGLIEDRGKFRVPGLRNIALTAPYMHDGSLATLQEVIDSYNRGGHLTETGPNQGDGATNPYKSNLVHALQLTDAQKGQLLAFLNTLTDTTFVENPDFASPWEP